MPDAAPFGVASVSATPVPVASVPGASPAVAPRTGNPATDFALELLGELVRQGLRHLVLSPGSRSQALALVAAELERAGALQLHVRVDERVAGFTALGIGLESGHPAAIVTTSGTATANLHPAVLEARASRVPLLVITADRPTELRGIRSNQTTVQPGLFGPATPFAVDADAGVDDPSALALAAWAAASRGPAHLNVGFRDPLSVAVPGLGEWAQALVASRAAGAADAAASARKPVSTLRDVVPAGPRTIVIAGNGAGEQAERFAREAGWPLIAEASSGSRFGPNLVGAYRELLADDGFGGEVERAVVFGHPTLSREVPAVLRRDGVEVIVVDADASAEASAPSDPGAGAATDEARPEFYDPSRRARLVAGVVPGDDVDPSDPAVRSWTGRWVVTGRRVADLAREEEAGADQQPPDVEAGSDRMSMAEYAKRELAAVREPVTRRMLAEAVWSHSWPHDRLVLGASRLIRELDRVVTGKKITVRANRGLAGIDGTVSTAIGIGLARLADPEARPGVVRVLLGDLTLLHDAGALLMAEGERIPPIQVVVGNDGGGTIFSGLEVGRTADADAMRRVLLTPRAVDLAALATAYGWDYRRATTRGELDQALSAAPLRPTLIEVPL